MAEPSKLLIIWSTGDREVALHNILMYTHNARRLGWWAEIRLLVWGPSAKLLSEDEELQAKVQTMAADGVELMACRACADIYGVSEILEGLGVNVFYAGQPLTSMLKEGWVTLTY